MSAVAFVAGATGYSGQAVVRELVRIGVGAVAHVRPDSVQLASWKATFTGLGAEVATFAWSKGADGMAAGLAHVAPTHVFALLGTTRKRARAEGRAAQDAYAAIDVGLTSMLIAACQRLSQRPVFVYLSAVGVRPRTSNPYLRARALVEGELMASGLPYVIARPSFLTGDREERRVGERVAAFSMNAALACVAALGGTRLRARYRSVRASELAQALVTMAFDSSMRGRVVYNDEWPTIAT